MEADVLFGVWGNIGTQCVLQWAYKWDNDFSEEEFLHNKNMVEWPNASRSEYDSDDWAFDQEWGHV